MTEVVSKSRDGARFGNDAAVVSKGCDVDAIGNDATVPTKPPDVGTFGNDMPAMFVRVRKRTLKGGHPEWRGYRQHRGCLVTSSASYDVVRAVRINGKPRQKFILGLGSIKGNLDAYRLAEFWCRAILRMRRHDGIDERVRRHIIRLAVRKGAPFPNAENLESIRKWQGVWPSAAAELEALLESDAV